MMKHVIPVTALLLAFAAPASAQHPAAELVRCGTDQDAACLRSVVDLDPGTVSTADRWSARLRTEPLGRVHARMLPGSGPSLDLLVLFDVSGSMAGGGVQRTRTALRGLLRELPGSVRVAVAPFGSRNVEAGIRAARFGLPSEAEIQMDRLPAPAGNTGLFSAVRSGVQVLQELDGAGDRRKALLVLTDGRNDIGKPGDDVGLLAGIVGQNEVRDAIQASDVHVFMIGIGPSPDENELKSLAGPEGNHYIVASDPFLLGRILSRIRDGLSTTREAIIELPATPRERLASGESPVYLFLDAGGTTAPAFKASWRPPLLALPAFQGSVDVARAAPSAPQPDPIIGRRLSIVAFFVTLLGILWILVPMLLWPAPAVKTTPSSAQVAAPTGGGLREGTHEAPPRRPTDVTAASARRVIRRV